MKVITGDPALLLIAPPTVCNQNDRDRNERDDAQQHYGAADPQGHEFFNFWKWHPFILLALDRNRLLRFLPRSARL